MKKNNQFDIMPGMIYERIVRWAKVKIENIGVKIPAQTGPISEVTSGLGEILPHPSRAETQRVFGTGAKRAVMRFALNHPEKVVGRLNRDDLKALRDPSAAEAAFHDQKARKLKKGWKIGDYFDSSVPIEERRDGFIPYQPGDDRIADLEAEYGIDVKPKNLVQGGQPVSIFDYVRPDGRVSGSALVPVEEAWRIVQVPNIAGAIGAKNAERVIAQLGLVDTTQPEAVSVRQAAVRKAVVEAAGKQAMGLTPELVMLTVQAFLSAAEKPELSVKEVNKAVSRLLESKK